MSSEPTFDLSYLDDCSVDSVVSDPCYAAPPVEAWKEVFRVLKPGGHVLVFGEPSTYHRMAVNIEDAGFEIRDQIMWIYGDGSLKAFEVESFHESVVVARKPFDGTVVENVFEHGTGGLNIDGCRVGDLVQDTSKNGREAAVHKTTVFQSGLKKDFEGRITVGRWPSNVIFDQYAGTELDWQTGHLAAGNRPAKRNYASAFAQNKNQQGAENPGRVDDGGGGSRYFFGVKRSKEERKNGLKPVSLWAYLLRLVTPEGGVVLDPFNHSRHVFEAASQEGFSVVAVSVVPGNPHIPLIDE
jgi:hypothetical protein